MALEGTDKRYRNRIIFASLVGTTIEFFDFYIYATAAVSVFPLLFFPRRRRQRRAARLHGDIRRRLCRAADRLGRLRPFRRSRRAQGDADRLAAADGPRHFRDRPVADLSSDRPVRADPAHHLPLQPGRRPRRRMVRRRSARHRDRRPGKRAARPCGRSSARHSDSFSPMDSSCAHHRSSPSTPRKAQPDAHFLTWGWRLPFLLSIVLVTLGLYVRLDAAGDAGVRTRARARREAEIAAGACLPQPI